MDLIKNIRLFSLPAWVKLFIAGLLGLLGVINTAIFFIGIFSEHRETWVKASIELLSTILPIFILAVVLWKSEAGVASLRRKTEAFFLDLLPSVLGRLVDADPVFFEAKAHAELADLHSGVKILVNLQKDDCYSDIAILAPDPAGFVELVLRLEINVKKVNFVLYLDEAIVLEQYERAHSRRQAPPVMTDAADTPPGDQDARAEGVAKWLLHRFRHTTQGATFQSGDWNETESAKKATIGGYRFNATLGRHRLVGRDWLCIVASCPVAPDFLYDPGERLFFAQDLLFFLRSFLAEGHEFFRKIPAPDLGKVLAEFAKKHP